MKLQRSRKCTSLFLVFVLFGAARSHDEQHETNCSSPVLSQSRSLSGTTGKLFTGDVINHYPRNLLRFQGQEESAPQSEQLAQSACSNWGVVTTIFEPSPAMKAIATSPNYCLVIVADHKTPAPYALSGDNIKVLTVEDQANLFSDFSSAIPWNHFGRKNLGFIYALQQGATHIFDFDDDNMPLYIWDSQLEANVSAVRIPETAVLLDVNSSCDAVNLYPGMGATSSPAWPRGFPLTYIKRADCTPSLDAIRAAPRVPGDDIAVFQSLANHDPDVDAIYRLTQPLPLNFDPHSPAVSLPSGVYSPYNAQATLHHRRAFWGLLLPVTVHGRVSDIWRSYFTQRLLWDAGLRIALTPPMVEQRRNPHNYQADLDAENDLYMRTEKLIQFLNEWKGTAATMQGRLEEMWVALYERNYIGIEDVHVLQLWIDQLVKSGYTFPQLGSGSPNPSVKTTPRATSAPTENKTTKRALVTGINGMIGSHIARHLVSLSEYEVYGLIRPRSNLDSLAGILDQLQLLVGDITDAVRMREIMQKVRPHIVFHFAAQAINGISYGLPELTSNSNVQGTVNIFEALRASNLLTTRVLLAGSSTEYGRTADIWDGPIPETAPFDPVSPYGVSKVATELVGREYFHAFGIPVITARFFIHVGIGGTESLALQEFARQVAMIERGLLPPVIKHGNLATGRDTTDIRDSAPAVVKLAEIGVPGEAYNIGSGISTSTEDLLNMIIKQSKVPVESELDKSRLRVYDEKILLCNNSKLRALTGWEPKPDLERTITDILNYWRMTVAIRYGKRSKPSTVPVDEGAEQKTVLITGISGMIGSHIARHLVENTHYVVYGLVRPRSNLNSLAGVLDRITLLVGDITDSFRMRDIMAQIKPDIVFHFAAQAINGISYSVPELTADANVRGTLNIFEALRASNLLTTRVLLAGSSTEYGRTADIWDGPIPETAPFDPVSPYGASKVATELVGRQFFHAFGIPVVTARFFIHVGVGGTESLALQEFARQVAMIERGLLPPVIKHGNLATGRDTTDIRDSAPAIVKLAEIGVPGEAYNVGSGISTSTEDLLKMIMAQSTVPVRSELDQSRLRVYDEKQLLCDNTKLRALTGWVPRPNLPRTIADILDYWRMTVAIRYGNLSSDSQLDTDPLPTDPKEHNYIVSPATRRSPAKSAKPTTSSADTQAAASTTCRTSNIDIFCVVKDNTFPMLENMLRSIELFMPCHGAIHIVVDDDALALVRPWAVAARNVIVHKYPVPDSVKNIEGYILQAWLMFWADKFASPTAQYVMFMDADAMLSLPITCRSLFSEDGRIYMPHWHISTSPQFKGPCEDFLGVSCTRNYMSYFPFTLPIGVFPHMRSHITERLQGANFNSAFYTWYSTHSNRRLFSQFVTMGNYMHYYHQNAIEDILLPPMHSPGWHANISQFVFPGFHYGWRQCKYVNGCLAGIFNEFQVFRGDGKLFEGRFSLRLMKYHEEIMTAGYCYMQYLAKKAQGVEEFPLGCSKEQATTIHHEALSYPIIKHTLDMDFQNAKFSPDAIQTVCPTVVTAHARYTVRDDAVDDLMA